MPAGDTALLMAAPGPLGRMQPPEADPDAYLEAFMNGFEFVLLAMRGRLQEDALPPAERARIEAFIADYARITQAYRERRVAPVDPSPLATASPFKALVSAFAGN